MQTFNYLIKRLVPSRQAWQAQAIVSQLQTMRMERLDPEVCIDRLLPVWEVIADNLMRHTMQPEESEVVSSLPVDFGVVMDKKRVGYEA